MGKAWDFVEAGELDIALFAAKIAKWRIEPKAKEFISKFLRQIGLYLAAAGVVNDDLLIINDS